MLYIPFHRSFSTGLLYTKCYEIEHMFDWAAGPRTQHGDHISHLGARWRTRRHAVEHGCGGEQLGQSHRQDQEESHPQGGRLQREYILRVWQHRPCCLQCKISSNIYCLIRLTHASSNYRQPPTAFEDGSRSFCLTNISV